MKLILAATAALLLAGPASAQYAQHTISVDGEAFVKVSPDYATITVGVLSQGASVSDALAENSTKMTHVIAAIRAAGIADKDIQTSDFSITPRYEKPAPGEQYYDADDMRTITGYVVRNHVTVTVGDLKKVAKVIDTSVQSGTNASGSVAFSTRDPGIYLDKVRAAAVDAAHHKAEVFTAAAHMKLGRALSVSDNRYMGGGGSQDIQSVPIAVSAFSGSAPPPTPILSGEITISAHVTVVYATD